MFSFFKKKSPDKETIVNSSAQEEDFHNVEPIANYFKNETGVTFDKQEEVLKNRLKLFCKQRDMYSFSQLLTSIQSNTALKQSLIDHLTTNETYFYREFKQIEQLVALVKKKMHSVRILCAPSSTGEEPYTIAIALLEAGIPASNIHIVGIDINAQAIKKANEAIYTQRHVMQLSSEIIAKYFIYQDTKYILKENVKELVTFHVANIFDASFKSLGSFDFVFSRNMLIYFDKETKLKAKKILQNMRKEMTTDVFFGHADLF